MKIGRLLLLLFTMAAAQFQNQAKEKEKEKPVVYFNPAVPTQNLQQVNVGAWLSPAQAKETNFPRYLICGAEMTYSKHTMPYSCSISKIQNQPIVFICEGGKPIWERTNGIRFKSCNFEDWDDQKSNQYYGYWEWTGMKMCPRNHFVYGYSSKINPTDGLNGLYLHCRNKFSGQTSIVTVREGKGTIIGPELTNPADNLFAYDYTIKIYEDKGINYITGLSLAYTPFPTITSIEVQYDSLPPWDIRAEYITPVIKFQNYKEIDVPFEFDQNKIIKEMLQAKTFKFDRAKSFTYSLSNFRAKYHSFPFKRFLKDNFVLSFKLPVIRNKIQEVNLDIDRRVVFKLHDLPNDFQFGKVFPQFIHSYDLVKFTVPKCNRIELTDIIYSSVVSNPYTMTIIYTSGASNFTEKVRGIYQGELFGRPELNANNYNNC